MFCARLIVSLPKIHIHQMKYENTFKASPLLATLREQKEMKMKGGIYHKTQIDLTYNSNHIEGSRLTHDQTRFIFETNTIGVTADETVNVNDIVETVNHFRCIDLIIDKAEEPLSEELVKTLHGILKSGTSDSRKDWFAVGDYKRLPNRWSSESHQTCLNGRVATEEDKVNEVGGEKTCEPELVHESMEQLIDAYNTKGQLTLEDILDFHVRFEKIHPFQDGNGRVGRLVMFKECLRSSIVPFIITDELKMFYYRGLREWGHINGYLTDTCLSAQDEYKATLDYFRIKY